MDVAEARGVLGVESGADWETIRAAYRRRIRTVHPDVVPPEMAGPAARVNEAYATLARAKSDPVVIEPVPPVVVHDVRSDVVAHGDTIHIAAPADEAFARLIEAAHRIGEVTYVDRSNAIFETVVVLSDNESYSLVITLQGRADGTDAFCTLEALQRVASPPVDAVVATLVQQMGS